VRIEIDPIVVPTLEKVRDDLRRETGVRASNTAAVNALILGATPGHLEWNLRSLIRRQARRRNLAEIADLQTRLDRGEELSPREHRWLDFLRDLEGRSAA
jgi:hypothetical protein